MKKLYSVFICLFPLFTLAQPTINQSDLPVAGSNWVFAHDAAYTDVIQAGGAGVSWNYSGLLNTYMDSMDFQASSGTPYSYVFPSSNIATNDVASGSFSYYYTDVTGLYYDGATSTGLSYDSMNPPLLYIPVPFTFSGSTNSFSQVVRDSTDNSLGFPSCIQLFHMVSSTFMADGYGTLTTPTGTFNNVLRINIIETATDSSTSDLLCFGLFITPGPVTTTTVTRYRYIMPGAINPFLLEIDADATGTTAISSSYLLNPAVNVNDLQAANHVINVYPNPANDKIHISLGGNNRINSVMKIYDAMSRNIYNTNTVGRSTLDIPVDKLESGIYHYSLVSDHGIQSGKFTVLH